MVRAGVMTASTDITFKDIVYPFLVAVDWYCQTDPTG